jgi:hypothetical protein
LQLAMRSIDNIRLTHATQVKKAPFRGISDDELSISAVDLSSRRAGRTCVPAESLEPP